MANIRDPNETLRIKTRVLSSAARLFLKQGFSETTVKEIASLAGVSTSTMLYILKSKEDILAVLVEFIIERQFRAIQKLLQGITDDPILFYATETTFQLHIVESCENIRNMYNAAYSLPKTTESIQHIITGKLENVFKSHLPDLETKDFFELEVASGGIMRGFMSIPCDMYFTMDRKIRRFLETTFLIYRVPDEKIQEAIQFVSQFDFPKLVNDFVQAAFDSLDNTPELPDVNQNSPQKIARYNV